MDIDQQRLQATLDLGLLTRVACHEINNLVASQQGFLRIMQRAAPDDPSRQRWEEQLMAVSQQLAGLVRGLQARAHASSPWDGLLAPWQPASAVQALAADAMAGGAAIQALELQRMISLTAALAGLDEAGVRQHTRLGQMPALQGAGESLFGLLADPEQALAIHFDCNGADTAIDALRAATDVILPGLNASPLAWQCALLAALLRNNSADLVIEHRRELPARLHLLIPLATPV